MHDPATPAAFTGVVQEHEERQAIINLGREWPIQNKGVPRPCYANAEYFLREKLAGKALRYNELTKCLEGDGKPISEPSIFGMVGQLEVLSDVTGWKLEHLRWAAEQFTRKSKKHHPIREYLKACHKAWDGQERINLMVGSILPCERVTDLHHRYLECFLVGAVARQFSPGCQNDSVLILQGTQGTFKSTFFRKLAPDESWYTNNVGALDNKDAQLAVAGSWIIEFAEMVSMRKSDLEATKNFITTTIDKFRAPYAKSIEAHPRTCAFGGTTNQDEFLVDPTGSRRFLVIPVSSKIDIDYIVTAREQIWGEAVAKYEAGVKFHLSQEEERAHSLDNAEYQNDSPWKSIIERALAEHGEDQVTKFAANKWYVTTVDLLEKSIHKPKERMTRYDTMAIAECLRELGWKKGRQLTSGGHRVWPYHPPEGWIPPCDLPTFDGFGA